MARTFGVRAVASQKDDSGIMQGFNESLGRGVSFPGNEYQSRNIEPNVGQLLNLDVLEGEPEQMKPDLGSPTVLTAEMQQPAAEVASEGIKTAQPTDPMSPSSKTDGYYKRALEKFTKAEEDKENSRQMRGVLEIMETATGMTDAYFRHKSILNQNNYNIMQANRQIVAVKNQAAFTALRESTKTQARKDSAKLDAVARGQSSSGDVAGIAENNEDMFLAQNLMSIEISAMREILGLEQDIIQYNASSKISEQQRNASMVNELATGAIRLGAI